MEKIDNPLPAYSVACALWVCSLPALQSAASAQTSQDTEAGKTSKPKKSKKAKAEAVSPESGAPAVANEKTSGSEEVKEIHGLK